MKAETSSAELLGSSCPLPIMNYQNVLLGHGSGGKMTSDLIEQMFLPLFRNPYLEKLNDQAVFDFNGSKLAFTTDSFVVNPIFFPGGDIGKLAVNGTVNDIAVSGAVPLYISAAFILEEGLSMEDLQRIVISMREAAKEAGVVVVTGDTKVVDKGSGDKIFINTSGIGIIEKDVHISADRAKAGDKVILSGLIGDHGMAIMSKREGLEFEGEIKSDTAPLHSLVKDMLEITSEIHCLRDPTRGGIASTLNEIARQSQVGIVIEEKRIHLREEVKGACEILGLDPLYVANEGKIIAIVDREAADDILRSMRKNKYGREAEIIGEVVQEHPKMVLMRTEIGGTRVVDLMIGVQLPRIC